MNITSNPISETQTFVTQSTGDVAHDVYQTPAVTDLMNMMNQMQAIFSKLRDVNFQYTQKQAELSWEQQVFSYNSKVNASVKQMNADITSSALSIASGAIAGAGIGVGVGVNRVGKELGSAIGRTTSDSLNGIGSTTQAVGRQRAELERLAGDLIGENASNYQRNIEDSRRLGQKFSTEMNEINRELSQLYARITNAIKF